MQLIDELRTKLLMSIGISLIFWTFCLQSFSLSAISIKIPKEIGIPYIHNYTSKDFGRNIQHWSIIQLQSGEFIIGNHGGYNTYDSASWQSNVIPGFSVLSMDIDDRGTVYVGGNSQIGVFVQNSIGDLEYQSLLYYIPEQFREFSYVRETCIANDGVYFRSYEYIFRWNGTEISVWEPRTNFHFMNVVNGQVFVRQPGLGLFQIKNDKLILIPGGEMFATEVVPVMLPWDNSTILIGTRASGFFIFDGSTYTPFHINIYPYIEKNQLYHGRILPDGSIILATLQGGVVQISRTGSLKRIINSRTGLQDDTVYYTYVDKIGTLWLCLNNGLSKVNILSPLTWFDERMGLRGMVLTMKYFNNMVYVGTTTGLFRLSETNQEEGFPYQFEEILTLPTYVFALDSIDSSLLIGNNQGIFVHMSGNNLERIQSGNTRNIHTSRRTKNTFYVNIEEKIVRYEKRNKTFLKTGESDQLPWSITDIFEDNEGRLWVATKSHGVFRFIWSKNRNENKIAKPSIEALGLPSQNELRQTGLFRLGDKIAITATTGIYIFDDVSKEFIPEPRVGQVYADIQEQVNIAVEDEQGDVWITSRRRKHLLKRVDNGKYERLEGYLRYITEDQMNIIYPAPDGTVWFGGSSGLIRYDKAHQYEYRRKLKTYIRSVFIHNDSLVYAGYRDIANQILLLPYRNNSIRFTYAIPSFDLPSHNRYQVKLDPFDDDWSRLMAESSKDYTSLREGRYTFRVRGHDVYGNISESTFFEFRILPPWYRTWWSYSLLVVLAGSIMLVLHKYRLNRALEVERTRMRIARDLHDDVGSNLSSIALMIDILNGNSSIKQEDRYHLTEISRTAREMIDSLRDVVWVINPEHDKLTTLIERMKSIAGLMLHNIEYALDSRIDTNNGSLDMDFKRSILLIFKEALANIVKHSAADIVLIRVSESNGIFTLTILDNGKGFDVGNTYEGDGLKNMNHRARQIGGNLTVKSTPAKGTQIELTANIV
jgi:signal transduction histidine kinase